MGKKILIVDDDRDLVRGMSVRLKAKGYDVVFAVDGISAMSVARKEMPDLILLDLGLPGGHGFMIMDRLSALAPLAGIPVIVLSGQDPVRNRDRALKAGAKLYLEKPVDNEELLLSIGRLIGEAGQSQLEEDESLATESSTYHGSRTVPVGLITVEVGKAEGGSVKEEDRGLLDLSEEIVSGALIPFSRKV